MTNPNICALCGRIYESNHPNNETRMCKDCEESKDEVIEAYNAVSKVYADKYSDEILLKPKVQEFLKDFVKLIPPNGLICDMGCGPGQVARYLKNNLGKSTEGVDLSPQMVEAASSINPDITFKCADVFEMNETNLYAGIIGLYFIVNFPPSQLVPLFKKLHSLLEPNGKLLISFHMGKDELNRVESLWDSGKPCNFYFFDAKTVGAALVESGFKVTEVRFREPDTSVEYNSQRAYIFASVIK